MEQHWKNWKNVVLLLELVVLVGGTSALTAVQSSTWDGMVVSNSVDKLSSTCSSTGFGSQNWIKIDFGKVMDVMGVTINGSSAAVNVRLGLVSDDTGIQGGFENNPLCVTVTGGLKYGSNVYYCDHRITGRYLSIQGVHPSSADRLVVCDVSIILAA